MRAYTRDIPQPCTWAAAVLQNRQQQKCVRGGVPADGVALNLDRADDFHDVFERRFNEEEQPEDAARASDAQGGVGARAQGRRSRGGRGGQLQLRVGVWRAQRRA